MLYLTENGLILQEQSAYRKQLSTEIVLWKVLSYAYAADVMLQCMLDLSVDHRILLARLRHSYGLRRSVLLVSHRTVTVSLSVWCNVEHGGHDVKGHLAICFGPYFRALFCRGNFGSQYRLISGKPLLSGIRYYYY